MNIENAIREVGSVYQSVTGNPIQLGASELPPEVDPGAHVAGRYYEFKNLIQLQGLDRGMADKPAVHAEAFAHVAWMPSMDVLELEREVRFEFDVPGVSRDQLQIALSGDYLVVRGERFIDKRAEAGLLRWQERRFGSFQRVVALPPRARREAVEAHLRDGILRVSIPVEGTAVDSTDTLVDVK